MKIKIRLLVLTLVVLCACGKDSKREIQEGEVLVSVNDCKTCHHATNKGIGPSHTEVAQKYEFTQANVSLLADRIIKGSNGIWGQIAMTAHPDLKKEDAEKIARYVLSLDGEKEK